MGPQNKLNTCMVNLIMGMIYLSCIIFLDTLLYKSATILLKGERFTILVGNFYFSFLFINFFYTGSFFFTCICTETQPKIKL